MNQARITIGQLFGTITSGVGAVASWQTQIDWALRVSASFVGLVVGILTIISLLKKARADK